MAKRKPKFKNDKGWSLFNGWCDAVIAKLHTMADNEDLTDDQKATLLIQTIDEAEELLGPIQQRLQKVEDSRQMELLPK